MLTRSVDGSLATGGHIAVLDGLRGVAILLVLVRHAIGLPLEPVTPLDAAARAVAQVGWAGVDLFFVLSGFLITGILLDTKGQPHWWLNFFVRRGLRIFPLYYGALVFIFILLPHLIHWSNADYATLRANEVWYWTYTVNFLNAFTDGSGTPLNTAHFWSLSIEEQFYLIWPLIVWRCNRATLLRVAGFAALAGLAFRFVLVLHDPAHAGNSNALTPARLDGLMTGAVLAVTARSPGGLQHLAVWAPRTFWGGTAVLVVLAALRDGFDYHDPVLAVVVYPVIAVVFGALLVLSIIAVPQSPLVRALSSGWLRGWGKYSYALYVIHYPLLGAMQSQFRFYERGVPALGGARLPAVLLLALIVALVSYGLAWLSYHLYEGPILGLKRYFGTPSATPPASPAPGRADLGAELKQTYQPISISLADERMRGQGDELPNQLLGPRPATRPHQAPPERRERG